MRLTKFAAVTSFMLCLPASFLLGAASAAQAAPDALVQRYNDNLEKINQLFKTLGFEGAVEKSRVLLPVPPPIFDGTDVKAIDKSLDEARGSIALHKLHGRALAADGQWEKAMTLLLGQLDYAKTTRGALERALAEPEKQWNKWHSDGKEFLAKNESRMADMETFVAKVQLDIKNHNEKKATLNKQQLDEMQKVKIPKAQKDEQELTVLRGKAAQYQDQFKQVEKFKNWAGDARKRADEMIADAQKSSDDISNSVNKQAEEIKKFNDNSKMKKKAAFGNKPWVAAVLNDRNNITKQGDALSQAQFLRRLLVLDPGNKLALKCFQNLKDGKEVFAESKARKTHKK